MKVLVYAFKKFDRLNTNPSAEVGKVIYECLKNKEGFKVGLEIFSVDYDYRKNLEKAISKFKPDLIIGLGASKRNRVSVETIALNVNYHNNDYSEISNGSDAIKTKFDCNKLVNHLKKNDIPVELSFNAGTYICNNSYYISLRYLADNSMNSKVVFLHVPLSPKEVNLLGIDAPSFPPVLIGRALASFLETY